MCYPVTPRSHKAEREGVEPTVDLHPRLFSKQLALPIAISPEWAGLELNQQHSFAAVLPLPTPIGEPTHEAVPTGVEPAFPRIERPVALPICLRHQKRTD